MTIRTPPLHQRRPGRACRGHVCLVGWNIVIINQSPNSPDLNILDLGFFSSTFPVRAGPHHPEDDRRARRRGQGRLQ